MDKVFPNGHREQSIRHVPRSRLETSCKMDWFRLIFRLLEAYFCYKAIATIGFIFSILSVISP